jgi:hypothetical protein
MRAIKSLVVSNLPDGTTYDEIIVETASGAFISLSPSQWNELTSKDSNRSSLYQETHDHLISLGVTAEEIAAL